MKRLLIFTALIVVPAMSSPAVAKDRVILFPADAVNVEPGLAQAVNITVKAEIETHGFEVVDHRLAERELLLKQTATNVGEASDDEIAATPTEEQSSDTGDEAMAGAARHQIIVDPDTAEFKQQLTQRLNCTHYIDGSLVRLGKQMQFHLELHQVDGALVSSEKMKARTEDDLVIVIPRLVEALLTDKTTGQTRNLDNATRAETQNLPQRYRFEKNFGVILGQGFGVGANLASYTILNFDGRFELNDFMAIVNAGMAIRNVRKNGDAPMQLTVNLSGAHYLTHTSVAPYLGAGVGMFIGDRMENVCTVNDSEDEYDYDSCDDSVIGWDLYPMVGLELMRKSSLRLHLDIRYSFAWAGRAWGHGPVTLVGINF